MYRTTQPGTLLVAILVASLVMVAWIGYSTGWHPVPVVVGATLALLLMVFRSLTIEIDAAELRCWLGDGLIRRRFPLSEIASARPVRNKWYYGWGVRWIPTGWMFNVSGLDAVELTLESKKRFRIGTDRPDEVVDAIRRFKGQPA